MIKYKEKYEIIGLTYNDITEQQLYDYIKTYDTSFDREKVLNSIIEKLEK